jgi:hypothetical protein
MGLFQTIKDSLFLSKCVAQVNHVSPAGAALADDFCADNKLYFLAFRDKGHEYQMSVNMACLYMTENPDGVMKNNSDPVRGARSAIIASNYCLDFISRWPNSELVPAFAAAIAKFIDFSKNDPIAKDLALMAAKR